MADAYANHRAVRVALNVLRVAADKGKPVGPIIEVLEESMRKMRMPFVPHEPPNVMERGVIDAWRSLVALVGTEHGPIDPCEAHPHGKAGTRYHAAGLCIGWSLIPVGGGLTLYERTGVDMLMWSPRFQSPPPRVSATPPGGPTSFDDEG